MKKSFLSLIVLVLTVFAGFGQVHFKPGIGMTLTDYVNFGDYGAAAKIGTQIGGSVAIGKKLYVEPGVFYATKSAEFTTSTEAAIKNTVKGIRVPVAVGVGVLGNEDSMANLRLFGGGSGFFVTGVGGDNMKKEDQKSPQWGVFAGAGVDIWLLYVDLSYEWSLSEASSLVPDGKARTFIGTIGLKF